MNNYLYNNTFTGSTHIDTLGFTSNFILSTSNILEQHINSNSNILEQHINTSSLNSSNYTNKLRFDVNKWINEEIEISTPINKTNTYIYNSNLAGEIRFYTESTKYFPPQILTDDLPYRTKIGVDGKLYVYYTYDSSISATLTTSWIDVGNTLGGIFANNVNVGLTIGGIQAEILAVQSKEENDIIGVYNALIALNEGDLPYDYDELTTYRETVRTGLNINDVDGTVNSAFTNIRSLIQTRNSSYIMNVANNINLIISRNPYTSFFLGVGGVAFGFAYGISQMVSFNGYLNSLMSSITSNIHLTSNQKVSEINYIENTLISSNYVQILSNTYQIGLIQGFINSNVIATQYINSISTNAITYNGVEISNGFLKKNDGGSIYKSIAIQASTAGVPAINYFGGNGDRFILEPSTTTTDYPCSLGIDNASKSFWFSASSNYKYDWYIGGSNLISFNSNNLNFSNGTINAYNLQQGGQNLNTITSNLLYIYDIKQYPPKLYDSVTAQTTITFLNKTVYYQTITINPYTNGYGIGTYNIYSSSYSSGYSSLSKDLLFNYDLTTDNGTYWSFNQYNGSGIYIGTSYIKSDYLGDWIIIKLPNPIILSKFRFYSRPSFTIRAPAEWKCYGSTDGITFNEIVEGSQTIRLTTTDYSSGYYEKQLASTFTTSYSYIGWTINKLAGGSDILNFCEIQMFETNYIKKYLTINENQTFSGTLTNTGTIINNGSITGTGNISITGNIQQNGQSIATISQNTILNNTPNVSKKYGFQATCSTSIVMPDSLTYYKYDIDLRNYTQTKTVANPNTPYRIFTIKIFLASAYFEYFSSVPDVLSYEIYMSNESQNGGGGGYAGINICALGSPQNYNLNSILPNVLSLLRTGDFNYLSVICRYSGALFNVIIEDLIY
jgi:hypothetical protein